MCLPMINGHGLSTIDSMLPNINDDMDLKIELLVVE